MDRRPSLEVGTSQHLNYNKNNRLNNSVGLADLAVEWQGEVLLGRGPAELWSESALAESVCVGFRGKTCVDLRGKPVLKNHVWEFELVHLAG